MKILHTSDWHLGNVLYGYDRMQQERGFLQQMADIVSKERPDCMIVSGDVYNSASASSSVQKMYTEGLLNIHKACSNMAIIVTAGNHDSPSKLEIDSKLWEYFNVFVVGGIEKRNNVFDFNKHIITIKNADGRSIGYVAAAPHFYNRNAVDFIPLLLDEVKKINKENLPVILSAHLAVTGSEIKSKSVHVQDFEFTDLNSLGEGYDYLALGHIHYPQTLKNSGKRARYCGSPIAVSFNEQYPHSVTIAEINKYTEPVIKTIETEDTMPLKTFPNEPYPIEEVFRMAQEQKEQLKNKYICFNILLEGFLPSDSKDKATEICNDMNSRFCTFNINRPQISKQEDDNKILTAEEFKQITPVQLVENYLASKNIVMTDDFKQMITEAQNFKSDKN